MDKNELINRLSQLPDLIKYAEENVIKAAEAVQAAKDGLLLAEDTLVIGGSIDGKNSEIRAAQLRTQTLPQRDNMQRAESFLNREKAALNHLINEMKSIGHIATMLKGGE